MGFLRRRPAPRKPKDSKSNSAAPFARVPVHQNKNGFIFISRLTMIDTNVVSTRYIAAAAAATVSVKKSPLVPIV